MLQLAALSFEYHYLADEVAQSIRSFISVACETSAHGRSAKTAAHFFSSLLCVFLLAANSLPQAAATVSEHGRHSRATKRDAAHGPQELLCIDPDDCSLGHCPRALLDTVAQLAVIHRE